MENNYQRKYFSFFNIHSNQLQIIKFKKKEEDFYAANTIWDSCIISNLLFELNFDDKKIIQKELKPFPEKIKILFLENFYYSDEKINFLILNKEFASFTFSFIIIDMKKFIYHYEEIEFLKTDPYKIFEFSLNYPGQYKVMFYINNIFQYHCPVQIKTRCLSKYSAEVWEIKNRIRFKLIPDDYDGPIKIKYWNLNNYNENYDNVTVQSEESLEELYVPLSELFNENIKENEFQRYLKIKLEDKYNAMGMMKIIDTLKIMNKTEEVKFMENLFNEDRELAMTIIEMIFDFDILFLIPENETREIMSLIDDYTLVVALKGETKNRIDQIKKCLSEKRWQKIYLLFTHIETIEIEKTDIAQKKIGTIIRSYYQKKYGIPFVFEMKKINRHKIRSFEVTKNDEILLPQFKYNGYYVIEFSLRNQNIFNIIQKVTGQEQEYKFYQKILFCTDEFFEIVNVDEKYLYLKFKKKIKKCMVVLIHEEEFDFQEFSKIYSDEILFIKRPEKNVFRMVIGTVNSEKENPLDEADVLINLYKIEENKIFIPDSIISGEKIPIKILNEKNNLFYIKQKEIPVSIIWNRFGDFLETDKKENLELSNKHHNDIIIQEIKDMDFVQNYISNNFNSITLFYMDEEELNIQNSGLYTITNVVVRMINNLLYFYNLTEKPFTLNIFQDNKSLFNKTLEKKYYESMGLKKERKIKVHIKSSTGEYIYHFLPLACSGEYDLKKKYELKGEDLDGIRIFLQHLQQRHVIYLIIELKIYHFKHQITKQNIFIHLMEIILGKIKREYFKNNYFIYDPNAEFNTLDIVDILLHLKEIYKAGFNQLDKMIETTFSHLKKIKFKDKRLKDYTRPKRFEFFKKWGG